GKQPGDLPGVRHDRALEEPPPERESALRHLESLLPETGSDELPGHLRIPLGQKEHAGQDPNDRGAAHAPTVAVCRGLALLLFFEDRPSRRRDASCGYAASGATLRCGAGFASVLAVRGRCIRFLSFER